MVTEDQDVHNPFEPRRPTVVRDNDPFATTDADDRQWDEPEEEPSTRDVVE